MIVIIIIVGKAIISLLMKKKTCRASVFPSALLKRWRNDLQARCLIFENVSLSAQAIFIFAMIFLMQLPFSDHYSSEEIYEARDKISKLQTNLEKGGFDLSRILESRRKKDEQRCLLIVWLWSNVLNNVIRTYGSKRIIKSNTWGTRSTYLWKSSLVDLQSWESIIWLFLPVSRE